MSLLPLGDEKYDSLKCERKRINSWIDKAFINTPKRGSISKKYLTSDETEFLLKCLDPESPNSFGLFQPVKCRNFVIVSMMLNCGIRPGELLSLRVEDIQIGAISAVTIKRRPPDPFDIRRPRPSVKRNGRVLPLEGRYFLQILDRYIVEWRDFLERKSNNESPRV